MIVDCHAHLGHWPFRKLADSTPGGLLRLMDAYGITQAWVGAFEGLWYRDLGQANRDLCSQIERHSDRLVPWAVINPSFPLWERDLAEAVEWGCRGVRLYPNYHSYDLTDDCTYELLAAAQGFRLPVAITHKFVDERVHPRLCPVPSVEMNLTPLVEKFPDLPLLWLGGSLPQAQQAQETIRRGRVYFDISRLEGIGGVGDLVETIGADRVLLGTHAPYFVLEAALLKIMEADLPESAREAILYRNAVEEMGDWGAAAGG